MNSANGGLTKPALDELRAKVRGALNETIASEARRMSGTEEEGLDAKDVELTAREGDVVEKVLSIVAKGVGAEIHRMEKRIAELETRPTMKYEGVWDEQKVYRIGDFCTDGGSMFCCRESNVGARPGSSDAWQLAVKKGRDGRDVRGSR
jgi:hypothetical protein